MLYEVITYSYNLMLNSDWQIVPAVQVGYGNRYIDFTKAVFPSYNFV